MLILWKLYNYIVRSSLLIFLFIHGFPSFVTVFIQNNIVFILDRQFSCSSNIQTDWVYS